MSTNVHCLILYNLKNCAETIIISFCMQYPDKFAPNLLLTYIYFAIYMPAEITYLHTSLSCL